MGAPIQIINQLETSARADVLLANHYPEYSRAALVKLFDFGAITMNDIAIKPGEKIRPGAIIIADISELAKKADVIPLPILYEDENVIVIDKPTGIISHARGRYWDEASVASFIRDKVSEATNERSGIVHRLDRATSGVMICAKNKTALSYLQKQFSVRKVNKTYIAIIEGTLEPEKGLIDVPIARNPNIPKTFRPDPLGKEAQTEYYTLQSNEHYSAIQLHPLTGRTHQLRVHLKYLKHPIVGDALYGGKEAERLFLHAHTLEITIPGGIRKTFTAPLPADFGDVV